MKTLAVWYREGESGGGFRSETATDRAAERNSEAGLEESPTKTRLKREELEEEPQLRR